ncbi:UspA domain protein [Halorubrum tebenquichense DSM 14210]|nr:UspA domain protein [Halorubrum tebenquichense DSM 14210]
MGTRGRTGIERYLLGSVTEKVVRLSDAPVVTVRADEPE